MKKTRKLLFTALLVASMFTFAACGNTTGNNSDEAGNANNTTQTQKTHTGIGSTRYEMRSGMRVMTPVMRSVMRLMTPVMLSVMSLMMQAMRSRMLHMAQVMS